VGIEFIVTEERFLWTAEGTLQFLFCLDCLPVVTFKAVQTDEVKALAASEDLWIAEEILV
jgi:hypothetical protein